MELILIGTAILICLGMSAFFSGSEVAVISVNRFRLRSLHEQGDATAGKLIGLLGDSQRLLVMVLIGNNLANVTAALFFKLMVQRWPGFVDGPTIGAIQRSELLSLALLAPIMIVFAEILPKAVFRAHADRLISSLRIPVLVSLFIFRPLIHTIERIAHWMISPLAMQRTRAMRQLTRKDVISLITPETGEESAAGGSSAEGSLGTNLAREVAAENDRLSDEGAARGMIQNIMELQETRAYEIMTPLAELVAVQIGRNDLEDFKAIARSSGFSRFPVYRDRIVNLSGYVDVFRVLREDDGTRKLEDFIEPAYFVPEAKRVDDLLQHFLHERIKNAIVVDEFGGCSGWISREDILEEIVGELEDELDVPQRAVTESPDGSWAVEGRIEIDRLNELIGTDFDDDDWETLAGLILNEIGRIPKEGDEVVVDGWRAHILRMERHRIDRVRLSRA
jgi:putative hemolysin